jgi:hypothetical protein
MVAFQSVLERVIDSKWEEKAPEIIREAMSSMDLKKRDQGSKSVGQKEESLIHFGSERLT